MTQLTLLKGTAVASPASPAQINFINSLRKGLALGDMPQAEVEQLSKVDASREIDRLKKLPKQKLMTEMFETCSYVGEAAKDEVPLSNYALDVDGVIKFYALKQYKGTRYLRQLIGHPGAWQRIKLSYPTQLAVLSQIEVDPLKAAQAYGEHFTCCAVCNSPLSDPLSRARKIGPHCWKRFGF